MRVLLVIGSQLKEALPSSVAFRVTLVSMPASQEGEEVSGTCTGDSSGSGLAVALIGSLAFHRTEGQEHV